MFDRRLFSELRAAVAIFIFNGHGAVAICIVSGQRIFPFRLRPNWPEGIKVRAVVSQAYAAAVFAEYLTGVRWFRISRCGHQCA
jgi:hypothetical protein